jgi:DNA-binding IclR family transcriptional regulator
MSNSAVAPGTGVQSVDRAVSILEILARHGEVGVSDVAAEIGVHKSTAFRLLATLEDRDLVEQTQDRGKYRLGFGVLRLAGAIPGRLGVTSQGRPACEALAAEIGETVNVAVLQAHYVVNVDQVRGGAAVAVQNWVGQLTPVHATSSGKVLLSQLTVEARHTLLAAAGLDRFTRRTVTSAATLERELVRVREIGYALTVEEYEEGLNAIAAPIRDHTGDVVAAVSVSGPAYRFGEAHMVDIAPRVVEAAHEISRRLGHLS